MTPPAPQAAPAPQGVPTPRAAIDLARRGDLAGAIAAGEQALADAPGDVGLRLFIGVLCGRTGAFGRAAELLRQSEALAPGDPLIALELARALVRVGDARGAADGFARVLAAAPGHPDALLGMAVACERSNQLDRLDALLAGAPPLPALTLVRARALRRRGRFVEALAMARGSTDTRDPLRAREIGENADRLGDAATAFDAFATMNALDAAANPALVAEAAAFREMIDRYAALVTERWYAGWSARVAPSARPAPVFLFGFPRSGTTLLDTMLLGHPGVAVLEEEATLQPVADAIGDPARLAVLTGGEIASLRALYWRGVHAAAPDAAGRLVVDKFPLGLIGAPIAHRLFPDARFVFAQRDPRDAVLSCFTTRFAMNAAMANFLTLGDTARLYDQVMRFWLECHRVFALDVHTVRYERLVDDPQAQLRPLLDWLGLDWTDAVLGHRETAAGRAFIKTPSYAQVTEPLYARSNGRWRRYAGQMAPVLPLLDRWAAQFGYSRSDER